MLEFIPYIVFSIYKQYLHCTITFTIGLVHALPMSSNEFCHVESFLVGKSITIAYNCSQWFILKIYFVAKVEDAIFQTCPKFKWVFGLQLKKNIKDIIKGILNKP